MRQYLQTSLRSISVVTLGELKKGVISAGWGVGRTRALDEHLRGYAFLAIDAEVAATWARLYARCDELGRPKSENDLWIAATAHRHGLPLATLDNDQTDVPGLTVICEDGTEESVPA